MTPFKHAWHPVRGLPLVVGVVLMLSLLVNLETIRTFPSWFDEAFMANVAFNLAKGAGRVLDASPGWVTGEVNLYGPVYFALQARLIDWFGLDTLVFRLPNLLSAYLGILVLALVLRNQGVRRPWWLLFMLLALVDVSVNRNLVSGRMDMLAVLFVLVALLLASLRPVPGWAGILRWLLIGACSALAYLTTPRALFLLPAVAVLGLASLHRLVHLQGWSRALPFLASGCLAFGIPVLSWILAVGGFGDYAAIFTASTSIKVHIAPSFFRSSYDNVGIGLMLVLAALHGRQVVRHPLPLGLLLTWLAFSLFVKEIGPYAGMIMPFVLAMIVVVLNDSPWPLAAKAGLALVLFLPGLLLLGLRGADLVANGECRDHARVVDVAESAIAGRTRIIAPFKYYMLLESPTREVTTFEYAQVARETMLDQAEVVVTDRRDDEVLLVRGFTMAAELTCEPARIPLLPETFLRRSIFQEFWYRR